MFERLHARFETRSAVNRPSVQPCKSSQSATVILRRCALDDALDVEIMLEHLLAFPPSTTMLLASLPFYKSERLKLKPRQSMNLFTHKAASFIFNSHKTARRKLAF